MDTENQATIKNLAEENGSDDLMVVFGAAAIESAQLAAETVTVGDPSFAGPLGGVSLRLPVYHILEPEVIQAIPAEIFDEQAGFMELVVDTGEIGMKFKEIREKMALV